MSIFSALSARPLSVRLSAVISAAPTEVFSTKFDTGDFHENPSSKSNYVEIRQKYLTFHMKT